MNNLTLDISFGTDFIKEVDDTIEILKRQNLILSFEKTAAIDSIKYKIFFKNADGAFLFGKSRPQIALS